MKKFFVAILIGVLSAVSLVSGTANTRDDLQSSIVRLHVRANSNSTSDQQLKLKVRDAILKETQSITQSCKSAADAKEEICKSTERIAQIAKEEIQKNGFDYDVSIRIGKSEFPTKTYDGFTLPAGTYEALTVDIGSGKGENWWCVMFPPLCFARESIDAEAWDMLEKALTPTTYDLIKSEKTEIKFKIYETVRNFISDK